MVLGHCQEPDSPPAHVSCPLTTPPGSHLPGGLCSQMVLAALIWKRQQFGGAGWVQVGGSQSQTLCRSCSLCSAAVLGMKTPKIRFWAVGPVRAAVMLPRMCRCPALSSAPGSV